MEIKFTNGVYSEDFGGWTIRGFVVERVAVVWRALGEGGR